MVELFLFYNIIIYVIYILLFGTLFLTILYFFLFKNKIQNILINDYLYNFFKKILILVLITSFFLFLIFFYCYFSYINTCNSFIENFLLIPQTQTAFFYMFDLSIDFFGLALLFLSYFVGILSLMALDNRIY